ncbi:MAG: hypothetical protein ACREWG_04105 [Gammaproteobacteria bacterium]
MRFLLQLLSGAVVALALGFFALLVLPDLPKTLNAAFSDPAHALLPGGSGYLLVQLLFAAIAAALALGCLSRTHNKLLFTIAAITRCSGDATGGLRFFLVLNRGHPSECRFSLV